MKNHEKICRILTGTILFVLVGLNHLSALGPTIPQAGIFESVSSHQVVMAKIDGNIEQICLPRFEIEGEFDDRELKKKLKDSLESQDAIFHLYHDGLGRPKKQGGMMFASEIYLKGIKMNYTAYLRKIGLNFKVSKTRPYEDKEHLRAVAYNRYIVTRIAEAEKADKDKPKPEEKKLQDISTMQISTIWDVLPRGVVPPSIRKQQKEIEKRIKAMKNRPYQAEIVKMDPVRWATGKFGVLTADGFITGSYLEGQKPDLEITPPQEKDWLKPEMVKELEGQPCEFVFQLDRSGHEVVKDGRYFLRNIYFRDLKLSWEEWLKKYSLTYVDPASRQDFATNVIDLQVKLISGTFAGMKAAVICGGDFAEGNPLVKTHELIRVFPPDPKPAKFVPFARRFNELYSGKPADFSLLLCPDGKPYSELGQKKARRLYFPERQSTLEMLQQELISGKIK